MKLPGGIFVLFGHICRGKVGKYAADVQIRQVRHFDHFVGGLVRIALGEDPCAGHARIDLGMDLNGPAEALRCIIKFLRIIQVESGLDDVFVDELKKSEVTGHQLNIIGELDDEFNTNLNYVKDLIVVPEVMPTVVPTVVEEVKLLKFLSISFK